MDLVNLSCKSCSATIEPHHVDLQYGVARCDHCDAVFGVKTARYHGPKPPIVATLPTRPPAPMPTGIRIEEAGEQLVIVRRWFSWIHILVAIAAVMWNLFSLIFIAGGLQKGGALALLSPCILLPVLVGVGVGYAALACLLNSTTISIDDEKISAQHGPLPWWGNVDLPSRDVEQIYSQMTRSGRNQRIRFTVYAIGGNGARREILGGLDDELQALFVEQQIEKHLGIVDIPVAGELPR